MPVDLLLNPGVDDVWSLAGPVPLELVPKRDLVQSNVSFVD